MSVLILKSTESTLLSAMARGPLFRVKHGWRDPRTGHRFGVKIATRLRSMHLVTDRPIGRGLALVLTERGVEAVKQMGHR